MFQVEYLIHIYTICKWATLARPSWTLYDPANGSRLHTTSNAWMHACMQTWDVASLAPASVQGKVNLILGSHALRQNSSIGQALQNLHSALLPGGFLLLNELLGPMRTCLWGLQEVDGHENDLTTVEGWKQALAQAGFTEVTTLRWASKWQLLCVIQISWWSTHCMSCSNSLEAFLQITIQLDLRSTLHQRRIEQLLPFDLPMELSLDREAVASCYV